MKSAIEVIEAYNRLEDCKEKTEFERADTAAVVAYGEYERLVKLAEKKAGKMVDRYLASLAERQS